MRVTKNIDGDLNIFSKKMIIDIYRRNNYRFYSYKPFYMKKIVKNKIFEEAVILFHTIIDLIHLQDLFTYLGAFNFEKR